MKFARNLILLILAVLYVLCTFLGMNIFILSNRFLSAGYYERTLKSSGFYDDIESKTGIHLKSDNGTDIIEQAADSIISGSIKFLKDDSDSVKDLSFKSLSNENNNMPHDYVTSKVISVFDNQFGIKNYIKRSSVEPIRRIIKLLPVIIIVLCALSVVFFILMFSTAGSFELGKKWAGGGTIFSGIMSAAAGGILYLLIKNYLSEHYRMLSFSFLSGNVVNNIMIGLIHGILIPVLIMGVAFIIIGIILSVWNVNGKHVKRKGI